MLEGGSSSTSSTESSVSNASLCNPGSMAADGGSAARVLSMVSQQPVPEGGVWQGIQDTRSITRFMVACGKRVRGAAMDAHGAFLYLIYRCLTPSLADEVLDECEALTRSPPDYAEACTQAQTYLMIMFKLLDQSSDFSERLESGEWVRECKSFDEFQQAFRRMMK